MNRHASAPTPGASPGSRAPHSTIRRRCGRQRRGCSADRRRGPHPAHGLRPASGSSWTSCGRIRPASAGAVVRFGQQFDADGRRHLLRRADGLVLLPGIERLAIEAEAAPAGRAFRRTIAEDHLAGLRVTTDHVRLTTGLLHRLQHLERGRPCVQSRRDGTPVEPGVPSRMTCESVAERGDQLRALRCIHGTMAAKEASSTDTPC